MYLRHEAGHAFNYAYKLYETAEWRALFGPFHRPYREKYRPIPFGRNFVRHIEGWYAQKHPDEDFAETFAVWLTPGSRWRVRCRGWPAIRKLRYVHRVSRALGGTEPPVRLASTDITVEEMDMTVEEFFRANQPAAAPVDVALENDLPDFFLRKGRRRGGVRPAGEMVRQHRADLIIPDDLPGDVVEAIQAAAFTSFQALQLRDYARCDFRITPDHKGYLIDANPNPYLYSGAEFIKGARASGRTQPETILEIVELALSRYGVRV